MEELLLGLLAILLLTVVVLVPIAALDPGHRACFAASATCGSGSRGWKRRLAHWGARPRRPRLARLSRPRSSAAPDGQVPPETASASAGAGRRLPPAINWELLIGRKGLGWVAVILLLFGTAFFLRYAYENQWIGPIGRVGIGLLAGLGVGGGGVEISSAPLADLFADAVLRRRDGAVLVGLQRVRLLPPGAAASRSGLPAGRDRGIRSVGRVVQRAGAGLDVACWAVC